MKSINSNETTYFKLIEHMFYMDFCTNGMTTVLYVARTWTRTRGYGNFWKI